MEYTNRNIKINASENNAKQTTYDKQENYKKLEKQIDKHIEVFKRLKDK